MAEGTRTRRINRGRGHSYELDGEKAAGVTTVLNDGLAKHGLKFWYAKEAANCAVDRWDELAQLGVKQRWDTIYGAAEAKLKASALRGTQIHELAQQYMAGQEVTVPDAHVGHVDACIKFLREWQPDEILVEATILNRGRGYMGTLDLLAKIGDETWLFDWKTSASGVYPESALQLTAYAYAEFWLDQDGQEQEMPPVDHAAVVWLRPDGYDVYEVEISAEAFAVFLHAMGTAKFVQATSKDRWLYLGPAMAPPQGQAA